jgi:two-component system sensor histidine kinase AtoS
MRIALKSILVLLALYLLLLIGVGFSIENELRSQAGHIYYALLLTGLAGLVAIIASGLLLQAQLRRMKAGLAALLEATDKGNPGALKGRSDILPEVRHAASRLGYEIKAAHELAALAQTKLDAVANAAEVGIALLAADGSPEYINPVARRILGGDRPEMFGPQFEEMRRQLQSNVGDAPEAGGVTSIQDIEMAGAGGVAKRLRIEVRPIGTSGGMSRLLVIKDRDVLDAMDWNLRVTARARTLSKLHAAVAHDLKAPLNAMNLQLEMLKRSLRPQDTGARQQQHYTGALTEELKRLNRLLQSVLELSAPTVGERGVVDLSQLIDELGILLLPQARHLRAILTFDLAPPPVFVFGDARQIKQALLNVVLTALESVPEKGSVEVRLSMSNNTAWISICDNGPGVPASVQAGIYDVHFNTNGTGTAIDLYVAREVIESHGGALRVDSTPGSGTCFNISLPRHCAADAGTEEACEPQRG